MSDIKCTVQDCHFNDSRFCTASAIEVNVMGTKEVAGTSDDTLCKTYKPQG